MSDARPLSDFERTGEVRPPQRGEWFESHATPGRALRKKMKVSIGPRTILRPIAPWTILQPGARGRVNGDGVLAAAANGRLVRHLQAEKVRVDRELLRLRNERTRLDIDIGRLRAAQRVAEAAEAR